MALIVSKQEEIDNYFASDKSGQSTLKKLIGGFSKFTADLAKEKEEKENQSFIIGSAVDCILTGEEEEFENQYYVSDLENKPTEVEMGIANYVFDNSAALELFSKIENPGNFENYTNQILEAADHHQWQMRWKTETRISKLIEACSEYFQEKFHALGKTIITSKDYNLISNIVFSLRNHHRTKEFFDRDLYKQNAFVDIYYQLPIYFLYDDMECKALLDMLIVYRHPETNKIESVQPVDLKTMQGPTINFLWSLKQWRYDIQAAFYTEAARKFLQVDLGVSETDYIIKPFKFVVESSTQPGSPLVYTMSEELLRIGKFGRKAILAGEFKIPVVREIRGFKSLVEEYKYYSAHEWKEDRRITEGNGVLKLDWDGINLK